jgi:hypothetical protein
VDGAPLASAVSWSWELPTWQRLGETATPVWYGALLHDLVASIEGPAFPFTTWDGQLGVRRWDGAQWVDLGGSPQRHPDSRVWRHGLTTDAAGAPIVVWNEVSGSGHGRIYASRWDGAAWVPLGERLNADEPSRFIVANGAGEPVVAWWACDPACHQHVMAWDGAAWVQLGDARPSDPTRSGLALDAAGRPHVLVEEDDDGAKLFVERWDGVAWQRLGEAFNSTVDADPHDCAIAIGQDGNPIVLWDERLLGVDMQWATRAKRWDGATWVELGGSLAVDAGSFSGLPALAIDEAGHAIAAWYEEPSSGDPSLYARRWDGAAWEPLGPMVNDGWVAGAEPPAIAGFDDGQLLIAWTLARGVPQPEYTVVVSRFNELAPDTYVEPEMGGPN